MLSLLKRLTKSKNPNSKRGKMDMASFLDGRHIKYVTKREDGVEVVVGREGSLNIRNGEFLVHSSGDIVFRTEILNLTAGELLSLDGVVLTGPNKCAGGEVETFIAYYLEYWK